MPSPEIRAKAMEVVEDTGCAGAEGLPGVWAQNVQTVAGTGRPSPARQTCVFVSSEQRTLQLAKPGTPNEAEGPEELLRALSLVDTLLYIAERLGAYASAEATTSTVTPVAETAAERVEVVAAVKELTADR